MEKSKKKLLFERILIFLIALLVIFLIVAFFKDLLIPLVRYELNHDMDSAKALLSETGWLGYITVSTVEALQMVVIFISAEFIQISSGMSYPWWLAIILCDVGVILGSSLIYFLVHIFKFDVKAIQKNSQIEKYQKVAKTNNSILFMYILFIMPIVPFGAICYWGANKKIPYHKYVFTCATGAIPSIITSIIMGSAIKEFITQSLPLWVLVVIIVAAAAILFVLLFFVLKKFFFKQNNGTPYSLIYSLTFSICAKIIRLKSKPKIYPNNLQQIEGPYLVLSNHHSLYDFNYLNMIDPSRNFTYVMNRYYFGVPVVKKALKMAGFIPKKIFDNDLGTIKGILKAKNDGFSIAMFPEGRLSSDGTTSYINIGTASIVKSLNMPLVLVQIRKAYFVRPKWKKHDQYGNVEVEVMKVLYPDELKELSKEQIHDIINQSLSFNEFECKNINIRSNKKAQGLENILYFCPDCHSFFTNTTKRNTMTCQCCHKTYTLTNDYSFDDNSIKNPHDYYQKIKEFELSNLDDVNIDVEVTTKIFAIKNYKRKIRKDAGTFHIDKDKVSYKSNQTDLYFEYKVSELEGIAYSVNNEFEMYYKDELYYFYPNENRKICTRIALLYEMLRERYLQSCHQNQEQQN